MDQTACVPQRDAAAAAPRRNGAPQRRCRATHGDVVARRLGDLVRRRHGRIRLGGDRTDLPALGRVVLRLPVLRQRGHRCGRQRRPRLHRRVRAHHRLGPRSATSGVRAARHHGVPPRGRRVEGRAPSCRPVRVTSCRRLLQQLASGAAVAKSVTARVIPAGKGAEVPIEVQERRSERPEASTIFMRMSSRAGVGRGDASSWSQTARAATSVARSREHRRVARRRPTRRRHAQQSGCRGPSVPPRRRR